MKMAILTLEKAIRDREQKIESFAQVIKDSEEGIEMLVYLFKVCLYKQMN